MEQNENLPDLGLPEEVIAAETTEVPVAEDSEAPKTTEQEEEQFVPVTVVEKEIPFELQDVLIRENYAGIPFEDFYPALVLPSVGYNTMVNELDQNMSNVDEDGGAAIKEWLATAAQGTRLYQRDNFHQPLLEDEFTNWDTHVLSQERKLGPARTNTAVSGGQPLTGIEAIVKATAFTTAGAVIRIPLFASGFWVTIKAPSDGDLLELDRLIANDRAEFGRLTSGRVFSASDVVMKSHLIALAMRQIVDSTYPDANADLRGAIKLPDLPHLIGGLALAVYPQSFPMTRACVAQPGVCNHVQRGDVAISKLFRYNNSVLTEQQRLHMGRNRKRCTMEDLNKYLEAFVTNGKDVIDYDKKVFFTLRTPSLLDYVEMGTEWVNSLENSVDEAFGAKISVSERNELIALKAQANALRQYSHWIDRITYQKNGEPDGTVTDRDDLYKTLELLSSDDRIASSFYNGVQEYINHTTLGIIAVPSWICPVCKTKQPGAAEGKWARLIPIDAASVFFTISSHRGLQVRKRVGI